MDGFIDYNEIRIEDKALFDHYLSKNIYQNSEFTFTNLFIWRKIYNLKFAVINDRLCVTGWYRRFPFMFPPLGEDGELIADTLIHLIEDFKKRQYPIIIKGISEEIKETIERFAPDLLRYKPDRDNYDYVYASSDLINLKGRKYQKKRNHINGFIKNYDYLYEPVNSSNIEECIVSELEWAAKRQNNRGVQEEKNATIEACKYFDELKIKGGALRINGKIQAFSFGELLNPKTAVIHIEKANADIKGSYAMINQKFAEQCWADVPYINREEDMGLPGLRKAKKSYYPVMMVKKYTGLLK